MPNGLGWGPARTQQRSHEDRRLLLGYLTVKFTGLLGCPITTMVSCTTRGNPAQGAPVAGSSAGTGNVISVAVQPVTGICEPLSVNWLAGYDPRLAPFSVTAVPGAAATGSGAYKVCGSEVTSFLPR